MIMTQTQARGIRKVMLRNLLKNCLTLMILTVTITVLNTASVMYFCIKNI